MDSVLIQKQNCIIFLPHDAMHQRGLCRHAVSVRPFVCLSHSWITSKRINSAGLTFRGPYANMKWGPSNRIPLPFPCPPLSPPALEVGP